MNYPEVIPIIPVYNQGYHLRDIIGQLTCNYFKDVIVVDDGSSGNYRSVISKLEDNSNVHLVMHRQNRGKGEALKTGFQYYVEHFADSCKGIVTLDADGQHLVEDVGKVTQAMLISEKNLVLGVRSFQRDVPILNKIGNVITQKALASLFGIQVKDTQTGLRGIPNTLVLEFLKLMTHRYDFEMECLIKAQNLNIQINQVAIETVYKDSMDSSHYHKFTDSLRISLVMIRELYKRV
jgi:glycosyltransferase involved in cell wall biosynthesis